MGLQIINYENERGPILLEEATQHEMFRERQIVIVEGSNLRQEFVEVRRPDLLMRDRSEASCGSFCRPVWGVEYHEAAKQKDTLSPQSESRRERGERKKNNTQLSPS